MLMDRRIRPFDFDVLSRQQPILATVGDDQ
jgi:hypothetical protein